MRVVSWNVNSVRLRLSSVRRFLRRYEPDVLCLQEIKAPEGLFPTRAFEELGYAHQLVAGQKGYNGVAILSREPLSSGCVRHSCGRRDARHVHALVGGVEIHNVYAPAGGDRPDPERNEKFRHKLDFYRSMTRWFRRRARAGGPPALLVGDLNVAPLENDVWSHRALARTVTHTPVEREAMRKLQDACGFVDALRRFVPESEKLFTWWSYRASDWRRANKGRRLDHAWIDGSLVSSLREARVIERVRGWKMPSDHAPVLVDLEGLEQGKRENMKNDGNENAVGGAKNPLLQGSERLPRFDEIRPEHVESGTRALVEEVERELTRIERNPEPTWEGVVEPIERLQDRLGFGWGIVEHLLSVSNSDALREAYEKSEPAVVKLSMRIGQSPALYRALVRLRDSARESAGALDPCQSRIVDKLIEEAELSGVGLRGGEKERFQAIRLELAELATRFGNRLLDATKAFALDLTSSEEVAGLPRSYLEMAAQSARDAGEAGATPTRGPWRITLDGPSYLGFMKHATRRDLRETLYRAFVTRASDGELDNTPVLETILKLRKEEAALLGFSSYAELSLSRKMAGTVSRAELLLEELREASFDAAKRELGELTDFMRDQGAAEAGDPKNWDIAFWSERLREARFDYSEEELRPYFPLPRVLEGLFTLAKTLFGIEVVPADGEEPVWHQDVRFFRVRSLEGKDLASFYLDPYSRPKEKRGGAWMNEVVGRSRLFASGDGEARRPVAYLICNGSPPVDGKPSLMTFREIETVFHEFGHTLQHMLTTVDYGLASGIRNVEWDAVELPSQFMENWCYHRDTLLGLSKHVESGERLPEATFDKIRAARTFQAGMMTLRQLYYAFTDLELHHRYQPESGESPFDVQRRISANTTILPPIAEDRFLCSFAHIFQGAYAAGYYSYKWAEVLSADAFAAFEEAGLDDEESLVATGQRFRETVLSLGGSAPPMEVFKRFRGREPSTRALLRHAGLVAA